MYYDKLYLAYTFILSLSSSQVTCERSFSTLKYILNALRYSLSQPNLEAFILMPCEKDMLAKLNDEIINNLTITSEH